MPILIILLTWFLICMFSYLLAWLLLPRLLKTITAGKYLLPNYRGDLIPNSVGVIFLLLVPLLLFLCSLSGLEIYSFEKVVLFSLLLLFIGILGLLDDIWGDHGHKGFRGHLGTLLKTGDLTTGAMKAIFALFIATFFAYFLLKIEIHAMEYHTTMQFFGHWLVDIILIVLVINTLNLFDLRPGRACKVFLFALLPLYFFAKYPQEFALVLPLLGILIFYLPYDLKAKAMLGDIGSNLLGACLGALFAHLYSFEGKLIVILVCLLLNFLAEKYSFSAVIEKNPVLKRIDMWGRPTQ